MLDAIARIVHGSAYDRRYATLPGDADAEQDAQLRRKRDKQYGSGLTIAAPSVGCEPPGGTGTDGVSRSRITPPRNSEPAMDRVDTIIEAKKKGKAAEAVAWDAAERQLCDWLWGGRVETLDRAGNTVPKTFYHDVSNLREASARGYRVLADGFLALIESCTPAPAMTVGQAPVLFTMTYHPDPIELPTLVRGELPAAQTPTERTPKRRGGPRPKYNWPPVLAKLRVRLEEDGAPEDGDGGQAKLEEFVASLFPLDRCPCESLRRKKVGDEIKAYRRDVNAEGQ